MSWHMTLHAFCSSFPSKSLSSLCLCNVQPAESTASCDKDKVSSSLLTMEQKTASQVHAQYFPDTVNEIAPVLA